MVWEKDDSNLFRKSIGFVFLFYYFFFFIIIDLFYWKNLNSHLFWASIIIILGGFAIATITQSLHYGIESGKNSTMNEFKDFAFTQFWNDCFIRCLAGSLEITFYTFSFSTNNGVLAIGYLVLKNISVWRSESNTFTGPLPKKDQSKEGRHTAILRIATILQLVIALLAAFFLFHYLKSLDSIFNINSLTLNSIFI